MVPGGEVSTLAPLSPRLCATSHPHRDYVGRRGEAGAEHRWGLCTVKHLGFKLM